MAGSQRTIILGFDGLDAKLTRAMLRGGLLSNFSHLAELGGFHEVRSTNPAESAVAWASFACSADPGQTGVFDFLGRRIGSYAPRLEGVEWSDEPCGPDDLERWAGAGLAGLGIAGAAWPLARRISRRGLLKTAAILGAGAGATTLAGLVATQWYPSRRSKARSTIGLKAWWDRLGEEGRRCTILRMPMTFPARAHRNVKLLCGLGTPDVRGTNGAYRFLSDLTSTASDGRVIPIVWQGGSAQVRLTGPRNPLKGDEDAAEAIQLERLDGQRLRLTTNCQSAVLEPGRWSGPIRLRFRFSPLTGVAARFRAYLLPDPAHVQVYLTPAEFDAADPPSENPIASPAQLSGELERASGSLRTIGWETQTAGLQDGRLSDEAYLADALACIEQTAGLLRGQLDTTDWDVLMVVFQATDQIQHMFFDDAVAAARDGGALPPGDHPLLRLYHRVDQIVGEMMAMARRKDWRLAVMSDHGMAPYRRSLHLNTWLAKRGWLALKDKGRWDQDSADAVLRGESWANVDWFNTRAYAVGLSGIYLNLAGREPEGIVKAGGEYEFLQARLASQLSQYRDPEGNRQPVMQVWRGQDLYHGPRAGEGPDLILGLRPGYRVSAASAVGGIPPEEMVANHSHWTGDHCGIHPDQVTGICLTNMPNTWGEVLLIASLFETMFADQYRDNRP